MVVGGGGGPWSQEQDLVILRMGNEAAQASATASAYEEVWQRLNKYAPLRPSRVSPHCSRIVISVFTVYGSVRRFQGVRVSMV